MTRFIPIFVFALFVLACGADDASNINSIAAPAATPSPDSNVNRNSGVSVQVSSLAPANSEESTKIEDIARQEEEKRAKTPPEFSQVNFENFTYLYPSNPSYREPAYISLKEGGLEYDDKKNGGGTTYRLGPVYYIDLANDATKEAVVFINSVSCGGSCDGGRETAFIYSAHGRAPKLLATIRTGSRAYGCSIKNFSIEGKEIHLEQFGNCRGAKLDKSSVSNCKFCVKDLTETTFAFKGSSLIQKSRQVVETPETNVMNYESTFEIRE